MPNSEKILFVDDDPNYRAVLQRAFMGHFPFDIASSGQEALDWLNTRGPYAVIVSDLDMTSMNGLELLSKVSVLAPKTVQMVLTGEADFHTFAQVTEGRNIFRYLAKPCAREDLRAQLIECLTQYRIVDSEGLP